MEKYKQLKSQAILPQKAKLLAWAIFLIFFIENGTFGILPKSFYFVYRNVRISDIIIYLLVIYSFFQLREFRDLFNSKMMLFIKLFFIYIIIQFVISTVVYNVNLIEYFFRLKGLWASFLIFPYLLLIKRDGIPYLIKIILPFAVVSNIAYIISAFTGVAILPEMSIAKSDLPGGFEVYRVYGGTFFGELYFLGIIYFWITKKFKLYQLPLVVLFILPHILAFGRQAWVYLSFSILVFFLWNILRKKQFRIFLRQGIIFALLGAALIFTINNIVPNPDSFYDTINARIVQGQEDVEYSEGTYGTRVENINELLGLWSSGNVLFGIGMHPLWVIRAQTEEENIYAWGFSDVRWIGVLAGYGLIGFLIAIAFQIQYIFSSYKILKRAEPQSLLSFFVILLLAVMLYDTVINYAFHMISISTWGLSFTLSFYAAAAIYLFEKHIGTETKYSELKLKASRIKSIRSRNSYKYRGKF